MVVNTTPKSHASTKPPMFCPVRAFSVIARIGSLLMSAHCMFSLLLEPCSKQEAVH
jgi:hypothetical protein